VSIDSILNRKDGVTELLDEIQAELVIYADDFVILARYMGPMI